MKHEQNIDCGGGYAKLFDCSLDSKDMHGDSPYLIMFGKDGIDYRWTFNLFVLSSFCCLFFTLINLSPLTYFLGPDICGPGTKKVHVIFNYKGKNFLTKKEIRCKDDVHTHLYTLIVNPDGTYEVLIDNEKAESGKLEEDWDFLPPKQIKDPEAKKPDDWDDREKIDDPEDSKPDDWEKPEHIADPDATKVPFRNQ